MGTLAMPLALAAQPIVERLNLRLPASTAKSSAPLPLPAAAPGAFASRLRFMPREGLIAQGIEASFDAVVQCQKGPYPGATVAAYHVMPIGSNAQPDHCYRY